MSGTWLSGPFDRTSTFIAKDGRKVSITHTYMDVLDAPEDSSNANVIHCMLVNLCVAGDVTQEQADEIAAWAVDPSQPLPQTIKEMM